MLGSENDRYHAFFFSPSLTLLLTRLASGKDIADDKAQIRDYFQNSATLHIVKRLEPPRAAPTSVVHNPATTQDDHVLPSQILAEKYFDQIFDLLTLPLPLCLDVWALLMKLPTNAHMEKRLKEITVSHNS